MSCVAHCLYGNVGYNDDEEEDSIHLKVQIFTLKQFSTILDLVGEAYSCGGQFPSHYVLKVSMVIPHLVLFFPRTS